MPPSHEILFRPANGGSVRFGVRKGALLLYIPALTPFLVTLVLGYLHHEASLGFLVFWLAVVAAGFVWSAMHLVDITDGLLSYRTLLGVKYIRLEDIAMVRAHRGLSNFGAGRGPVIWIEIEPKPSSGAPVIKIPTNKFFPKGGRATLFEILSIDRAFEQIESRSPIRTAAEMKKIVDAQNAGLYPWQDFWQIIQKAIDGGEIVTWCFHDWNNPTARYDCPESIARTPDKLTRPLYLDLVSDNKVIVLKGRDAIDSVDLPENIAIEPFHLLSLEGPGPYLPMLRGYLDETPADLRVIKIYPGQQPTYEIYPTWFNGHRQKTN